MSQLLNGILSEEQVTVSIRERITKYLSYWPLFLICLVVCMSAGILYTYYALPKYIATTSFLVKVTDKGEDNSADLIEKALKGKSEINLSNEIAKMQSTSLMKRVVEKYGFNTSYYIKGRLHSIEVYKQTPFTLIAKQLTDSNSEYNFYISNIHPQGGTIAFGKEKEDRSLTFQWNKPFINNKQTFVLAPKGSIEAGKGEFIVRWDPVYVTADLLSNDFSVKSYDPETSIVSLALKTENLDRGKDVLNAIFTEFNLSDIEDRNLVSRNTIKFIDARLLDITDSLENVEGNLANLQGSHRIVDIQAQSAQGLGDVSEASKAITTINVQQRVTNMLSEYIANPANNSKPIPGTFGLQDPTLAGMIEQYNQVQLRKEKEAPNLTANGTVMQDLNTQISTLKSGIVGNLGNISKNLQLQQSSLQQQSGKASGFLSQVPSTSKALLKIQRQQGITSGLYTYLFQKKEEVAIEATAANVPHYVQLDPASGYGPVEPNKKNILLFSALAGLFLAFGFVYVRDLLNDSITSRESIIRQTSIPLLGQIAHIPKKKKQVISVIDRSIIGEQFRAIRTNLSFMMRDRNKKTILVTSSVSGEGKSFISLNMAAVYALPGKKVALLEFDLRKPSITSNLQFTATKGITEYLAGETKKLDDIFYVLDEIPTLHIYPCGNIAQNPADLLLTDNMNKLFEKLKVDYDYVIIDSPPIGLVSDAFLLGEYSDMVVYVSRNQKTTKKQIEFLNHVVRDKTLKNVILVLNDVKKGSDTYGYGGDYSYGNYNGTKKKKDNLMPV